MFLQLYVKHGKVHAIIYAIAYAIMNGMDNLLFDKVEIENISRRVPIRYKHSWKFGRTRNCVETLAQRTHVPTSISRSPKLPRVFL